MTKNSMYGFYSDRDRRRWGHFLYISKETGKEVRVTRISQDGRLSRLSNDEICVGEITDFVSSH